MSKRIDDRAWRGFGYISGDEGEQGLTALLYHPRRPCANPGAGIMMNKQRATGVGIGITTATSWLQNNGCK
jgi:hypothetical protein